MCSAQDLLVCYWYGSTKPEVFAVTINSPRRFHVRKDGNGEHYHRSVLILSTSTRTLLLGHGSPPHYFTRRCPFAVPAPWLCVGFLVFSSSS
jgi:hypothetical protein